MSEETSTNLTCEYCLNEYNMEDHTVNYKLTQIVNGKDFEDWYYCSTECLGLDI